jgi:hypothetical protein
MTRGFLHLMTASSRYSSIIFDPRSTPFRLIMHFRSLDAKYIQMTEFVHLIALYPANIVLLPRGAKELRGRD